MSVTRQIGAVRRAFRGSLRTVWRHLPAEWRRSAIHSVIGCLQPRISAVSRDVVADPRATRIVVGLLSSASGLGQSARLTAAALRSRGYRVLGIDLSEFFYEPGGIVKHGLSDGRWHTGPGHAIIVINGPFMPYALTLLGRGFLEGKWVTGYWAWELSRLPDNWMKGFPCVDEVAVPSGFVAEAVEAVGTAKRILVAPHPVCCDPPALSPFVMGASRPEGPFTVISVANLSSSGLARKNPLALIGAYKLAFGGDRTCRLRMRLTGSEAAHRAAICAAVGESETIEVEWRVGSRAEFYRWWGTPDVYAALHRSEGFGLPIAEAMLAGYPVVATGWSGNMEFMNGTIAFPVDYRLTSINDPDGKYSETSCVWAEPDIEHAAAILQWLRRDPELVRKRGGDAYAAATGQLSADNFLRSLLGKASHRTPAASEAGIATSILDR
jgi:glycosyltransferase involved in cell wall biosynthesis